MPVKIEWRPVLQPLMLKEYHADYGEERIMVCVNPRPDFLRERSDLIAEYTRRAAEMQLLANKARIAGMGDGITLTKQQADDAAAALIAWGESTFIPAMHNWFARLWSFGDDRYTAADVDQYQEIDPHFVAWAKARSIEMIEAHASARKKV
jgi:hypothetical protein